MRPSSSRLACGFLLALAGASTFALRAAIADEPIDDPKVGRRLGTRLDWPGADAPIPAAAPQAPSPAKPEAAKPDRASPAVSLPADPGRTAESPSVAAVIGRRAPPPASDMFSPPRVQLAYRHFDFVQIGAAGATPGLAASEPFHSLSVDVYPLSSFVRLGLSTQYGWQAGTWTSSGDYFAAESLSGGVQLRGARVVPFAEAFAGIGYMRRLQFDRTVPTAYWQLGADLGADLFVARSGFVSLAIGYLRAVNGFLVAQQFTSAFLDTWSFKIGVGL